jgi:hypothetical protein
MRKLGLTLDTVHVTVFLCAKCSTELTPDLAVLIAAPEVADSLHRKKGQYHASSTIPRGHYAVEPESWGAPFVQQQDQENPAPCQPRGPVLVDPDGYLISAGPRDTVIVHPDDAPLLRALPDYENSAGCCGPDGKHGPNRACPCGTAVATLAADCTGPYELHLDPVRTYPLTDLPHGRD